MMKSSRAIAAAVFLLGLVLGAAAGSWGQRALFHRQSHGPDAADRHRALDRLSRELGLDDKQKEAVGAVMDVHRTEVDGLKKETFARLETIRNTADAEIKKVLTPAQAAKFDELHRGKRLRVNWEAPPPPTL
jgi:Spy/CpxP family protein refolding chaperone